MHLSKLLLPMLWVGYVAAQSCDGIEKSGACCVTECGECGGSGCSDRGGGLTGDDCCTSNILASGVECGSAPCIVGSDPAPTPTPPTPSGSFTCDGVAKGDYCCTDGCGECGGSGCSNRGGGLTGDDCCHSDILAAGNLCSVTGGAPCIIDGDSAPTPTTPTPTAPSPTPSGDFTCDGVQKGDYCCSAGCGECGGSGCSSRGGGLTGDDCCQSDILAAGNLCSVTGAAPCIIDGGSAPSPTPTTTSDYESVGCFEDDRNRIFSTIAQLSSNSFMTTEYCAEACSGSTYFGTQYGYQCFCSEDGESPDFLGTATNCDTDCSGDSSQTCGGSYAMSVYQYSGTSPSPITPTPVSPSPISVSPTSPTPTTSPTPVMEIPTECTSDVRPTFRYAASSGVAGRLYAEGEGCFTITDLYNFRGVENDGSSKGPIYVLDDDGVVAAPTSLTNRWLLAAELYVTGGGIFYCRGSDIGGDCDELRIQSTGSDDFHEVRGHGGSLYFESTIVTSWDTPNNKPQEEYEGGRSFLNCVSEKLTGETCEGAAKNEMGECRMDIIDTEIGYLGYFDSESYGMTWKVRGFCVDKSNQDVFETTNVYGDIKGSDIHHLYYGHYTYGHQGGVWDNNKMHDNWQYGFDPHDDSDYLTISNNEVYNNINHGIIASKRCNNVKIFNNVVRDGGAMAAGIFLHRSSDHAEVYNNQISNMQDAGIAMLESFDALIYDNTIDGAKYGIRMSLGSARNQVYDNSFTDITDQALYTYEGSDEPDVAGGRPYENVLSNNVVTNCPVGVKIKAGDDNVLAGNTFVNVDTFEFPESTNTLWTNNNIGDGCIEEDDEVDYADGSDAIPVC